MEFPDYLKKAFLWLVQIRIQTWSTYFNITFNSEKLEAAKMYHERKLINYGGVIKHWLSLW